MPLALQVVPRGGGTRGYLARTRGLVWRGVERFLVCLVFFRRGGVDPENQAQAGKRNKKKKKKKKFFAPRSAPRREENFKKK